MTEFEVINRVVDVDGTKKMIRGVWLTTIFFVFYLLLKFAHKITPMTKFEVINRVVDVDGTNKIIRGVWLTTNFFVIYFFLE